MPLKKHKKITLFLSAEVTEKIRQFKLPRIAAYVAPVLILIATVFLFLGFLDYLSLK